MPKLFKFTDAIGAQPNDAKTFGKHTADTFRLTSSFDISTPVPAYAMMSGMVLLQRQAVDLRKANLILKPDPSPEFKLPIKYIIYRGLNIDDYITFGAPDDLGHANSKVKIAGLEMLDAMVLLQSARAPGEDIPVEALFGAQLAPLPEKDIEDFFAKTYATSSQLFPIKGGIKIGNFQKGTAVDPMADGEVGIEIVLENLEYKVTVEIAKKLFNQISVIGILDAQIKKWTKDQIRHFVDPAAFYGMHHDIAEGIGYRISEAIQTPITSIVDAYDHIISVFNTKNNVYLDIRSEHGYSYNYYDNYVGISGPDVDKELMIGPNTGGLLIKEYYTNDWPLHVVSGIIESTTLDINTFSLKLRINDNKRPLLLTENNIISPVSVQDGTTSFISEADLLPSPIPITLPEFSNELVISVPNKLVASVGLQIATYVRLDYMKQALPISDSDKFPYIHFSDYMFGPLDQSIIPFNLDNQVQWISSKKMGYVDALNDGPLLGQMQTGILNIITGTKEIEIFGDIPLDLKKKIKIVNTASNPTNEGE